MGYDILEAETPAVSSFSPSKQSSKESKMWTVCCWPTRIANPVSTMHVSVSGVTRSFTIS